MIVLVLMMKDLQGLITLGFMMNYKKNMIVLGWIIHDTSIGFENKGYDSLFETGRIVMTMLVLILKNSIH